MKYIICILILFMTISCKNVEEKLYDEIIIVDTSYLSNENNEDIFYSNENTNLKSNNEIIYENSSIGDINYIINDTMILNRPSIVNLTISNDINKDDIISEVETFTESNTYTQVIRISPIMKVSLIDPNDNNFKIKKIISEKQILEEGKFTKWEWEVTPLQKGNNRLKLSVDIIYQNIPKNIKVYENFIYIYSDKTIWNNIIDFFKIHWEWLITTLIIPVFIFFYKKKRKKNK